jgi:hypothetical protein
MIIIGTLLSVDTVTWIFVLTLLLAMFRLP